MEMIAIQIEIFIMTAVGFFLGLRKTLDAMTRAHLVDVIMAVVLPASVISSFEMELTPQTLKMTFSVLMISCALQVFYAIWNHVFFRKTAEGHRVCLKYGIMVSNAGLIGMPVAQAYFGAQGLLCASIFLLPQRVLMFTYGVSMFAGTKDRHAVRRVLTHPCVLSIFIGFAVMALYSAGYNLPSPVVGAIDKIGGCSTALSMFVVGAIISECPLREVLDREALIYSFERLIAIPVIVALVLHALPVDAFSSEVCVLLSAMPAASTTAMLAEKYHADSRFASKLVMTSTVLSLITVPAVGMAIRALWAL